ncbi:Leucine-rich repeat-containing protein 71 [Rhizophlyctis rosea]|nr:Leucine-rich repeat-containing protein 71 [Rhizophlyctis rosea]
MAADTEEQDAQEYTGNFEIDYLEACRRQKLDPLHILKIGHPLPPIPMPITPRENASTPPPADSTTTSSSPGDNVPQPDSTTTTTTDLKPAEPPLMSYHSRFQFKPSLIVETAEGEDDEEVYKVEVRGWKLSLSMTEALCAVVPACNSITHLTLWNCGLTSQHFTSLLPIILSTPIRFLTLDQNPLIPDTSFALLLTDDSSLQSVSLRSNGITDAGAKALAQALKTNRVLTNLNLWDNSIGKEGAEALADSLKLNTGLVSLSLGRNFAGDEGVGFFAKVLSNYALSHDEIMARRKTIGDLDKQRRDQLEEDLVLKKGGKRGPAGGRRMSSAKLPLSAQQASTESIKSKDVPVDPKAKGAKPGKAGKKDPVPATPAAAPPTTTSASKKTPDVPPTAAAAKGGKGAAPVAAAPVDDKTAAGKGGKDKDKKGGAAAGAAGKGAKKGKVEETKEEMDEALDTVGTVEPMFELNGQWYVLGNRTLNNLNLSRNGIREEGLKHLLDAVMEQEAAMDNAGEGMVGVFRIALQDNLFDKDSPNYTQLIHLLNTRNPYFEQPETDGSGEAAQEGGEVDKMDSDSAIEEEPS